MRFKTLLLVLIAQSILLCAAGPVAAQPNAVETDAYFATLAEVELIFPDSSVDRLFVTGPATMLVFFEGLTEGVAYDDNRNLRDEVDTELVALNLLGSSATVGPVSLSLAPTLLTQGQLEEETDILSGRLDVPPFSSSGSADCELGLYFAMNFMGQDYHNEDPLDLLGAFHHKPAMAGDVLEGQQSVALLDTSGQPSGIQLRVIRWWLHAMIEVDEFSAAEMEFGLRHPDGSLLAVRTTGLMRQHVYFEGDVEGSAVDDDENGQDEVSAEIVELSLQGFVTSLGTIDVVLNPNAASYGVIEEQVNLLPGTLEIHPFAPSGPADSFFNVFVEVETGGEPHRHVEPIRLTGTISNKPPGPGDSLISDQHVVLLDATGQPSGFVVEGMQLRFSRIVEIDIFPSSRFDFQLELPTGPEILRTYGSMTMHVFFDGAFEGSAEDDDLDSMDEVGTEVVQLDLTGTSPNLGTVAVRLLPGTLAPGEIEERVNAVPSTLDVAPFVAGGSALSMLDMVLRLQMLGGVYFTDQPLHLEGIITHKPPRDVEAHRGTGSPVQLMDLRTGEPADISMSLLSAWFTDPMTAVDDETIPPRPGLELRVWPNPLNPHAVISYRAPRSGMVSLTIFDVRGRLVRELFEGMKTAGEHRAVWDGRDDTGAAAASGAYLIRLSVGGEVETRKIAVVW